MKTERKQWVKFFCPGLICGEDWNVDTDHVDPSKVEWPDNAYAFQFYGREDVINDDKRFKGDAESIGPMYYHPDSKVETLAEVKKNPDAGRCLASNMECNDWDAVVWSRWGNWPQPFEKDTMVIL